MADRFLLQSGSGIIELQSSTDDLILQSNGGASAALDDGGDSFWGGFQSAIVTGAVIAAMALSVGNARAAASPHQDEVPYATGNSVRYDKTPTFRAQVKPVFIQIGGGEDFTPTATPTPALDESTFNPTVVRNEVSIPYSWPDEAFPRIPAEVENWAAPFVVPQIPVAPVWDHQDEVAQTPVTPALEESEFVGAAVAQSPFLWLEQAQDEIFLGTVDWSEWSPEPPPPAPRWSLWQDQDEVAVTPPTFGPEEFAWITYPDRGQILPDSIVWVEDDVFESIREESVFDPVWTPAKPFTQVFSAQEEIVQQGAVPQGGGGLVYDEISIFRWYQEDDLPIQATPLGVDEEPWKTPWVVLEPAKWLDSPDELIVPQPTPLAAEDDTWLAHSTLNRAASPEVIVWVTDDEYLPFPEENEQWPLTEQVFPGPRFTGVFSAQDEVLPSVRDEEPWIGPSYPAGPFTGTFSTNDDIVPQPPIEINVEETYWIQPDPPRGVVTSWQFSIEVNEDFPELRPGPPLVVTPDVTGGWPMYYGRIRKPRIEQVTKTVTEIQEDIQQAKNRLEAKKELRRQEKRAKYVTEEIRQILDEQDRLKLSIEALRLQLKQAGMEEEEILLILALAG